MKRFAGRGFGLISLLIAIAVFVIGATAFIRAYYGSFFAISSYSDRFVMVNISRAVMERVMKTGVIPVPYEVTYNGITYDVSVSREAPVWLDEPGCNISPRMWSIRISVTRRDKPTRILEICSLRER